MTDTLLSSSRKAMQGEVESRQLFFLKMQQPGPSSRAVFTVHPGAGVLGLWAGAREVLGTTASHWLASCEVTTSQSFTKHLCFEDGSSS